MIAVPACVASHDAAVAMEFVPLIAMRPVLIRVPANIAIEHDLFFRHYIGTHLDDKDLYQTRCVVPPVVLSYRKHSAKSSIVLIMPFKTGADKLLPDPVS